MRLSYPSRVSAEGWEVSGDISSKSLRVKRVTYTSEV